jgi:hypothetical protein
MKMYFDENVNWDTLKTIGKGLTKDTARFEAKKARNKIIANEKYNSNRLRYYYIRPMEIRWCYYSPTRPLWNEPRPSLWEQSFKNNKLIISRFNTQSNPEGIPICISNGLFDKQMLSRNPGAIPIYYRKVGAKKENKEQNILFSQERKEDTIANLSRGAISYIQNFGLDDPNKNNLETASIIWMHSLAIGYSHDYLSENADGIRGDWPRIPLPNSKDDLVASAKLGCEIASLLDIENDVKNVSTGTISPELQSIAVISRAGGGNLNIDADELALTAGWGHGGKDGITMPGKGKIVERAYTNEEKAAIEEGEKLLGLSAQQAFQHLGEHTCDIYLNEVAYWKNIPIKVWKYTIGGYQVTKKWLSYREQTLLGRPLKKEEAREVMNMARRIAAIVLMEPALNENYQRVKKDTYPWPAKQID